MANGYGILIDMENEDRYEGQFLNSLKHGSGKEIFGNGDVYIGHFRFG